MGIVLRGGTILDRKGERSLDVSIDSDGKISETGKKLNYLIGACGPSCASPRAGIRRGRNY